MKTLVVANQKGAVGKTSTFVRHSFDFLERGLKILVIDLDTQDNASYTLQSFPSGLVASELFAGVPSDSWPQTAPDITDPDSPRMTLITSDIGLANLEKISLSEADAKFRDAIKALDAQGFHLCLVDTATSLGISMAAALLAADYVLSQIELEAYSIQGIKQMVTTIVYLRKAKPKLKFLGIVPSMVDARNPRHGRHLQELEPSYPQLMIPTGAGLRSSTADALASRVPVWKTKKTAARKATQEIRALASHVFEKIEMTQ